ncbi:hypothetical protein WA158_007906 [Blastocystis sp. Blastoise]
MLTPPTVISQSGMTFVITGMPREYELSEYIELYKKYNVTDVVRTCQECEYDEQSLSKNSIESHVLIFDDGAIPPKEIIIQFLELVNKRFFDKNKSNQKGAIAVHCKAGLGRAPTLVTIALIEKGMTNVDAIEVIYIYCFIFTILPQAFNQKQLCSLYGYHKMSKCSIM